MKTIYLLLLGLLAFSHGLFAQRIRSQIGVNVVPLFDKTVEVNASWTNSPNYDFYFQGGYTFPRHYQKNKNDFEWQYWEGKSSGAYLRVGGRAFLNPNRKFRMFLGVQLTESYFKQSGTNYQVIECIVAPCYPLESAAAQKNDRLSAGITGGFRTNLASRLTLDLGIQANAYVFGKPDLLNNTVYVPGVGRKTVQGVASIQYTLKGR
ncbi:DUF3575 domain-containing protein [Larkinella humicola]|uniref:DUF3575 domain-containing protein n=1 Tax=Larkinella humicola TaxID=2607654 RepID=A0A5N1JC07_9BACT|nr:DUF3575 domain-containing protein [Larkinella humicola]KAA9349898.1 DUF3575 domain-containing protein [Larkinella humicola]